MDGLMEPEVAVWSSRLWVHLPGAQIQFIPSKF